MAGYDDSVASNPVGVSLSRARFERLGGLWERFVCALWKLQGTDPYEVFDRHLRVGDSRAAIVMSVRPLLVAAYTDELDCVVMLRFPRSLVREHGLQIGTRLLTVNTYFDDEPLPEDLVLGPLHMGRYTNVHPLIAEFLTDERDRIASRKAQIHPSEWARCLRMGIQHRTLGRRPRSGRPTAAAAPGWR